MLPSEPSDEGFFRDLFLQSSVGTPLAHFGTIWVLIWPPFWTNSEAMLFSFAFHWPSKLGHVEIGRRNSRRDINPPHPARRGQGVPDQIANSDELFWLCKIQKLFGEHRSSADPCCRIALFKPPPHFLRFVSFFGPLKESSKIGPLSNPLKISKIGPLGAQS